MKTLLLLILGALLIAGCSKSSNPTAANTNQQSGYYFNVTANGKLLMANPDSVAVIMTIDSAIYTHAHDTFYEIWSTTATPTRNSNGQIIATPNSYRLYFWVNPFTDSINQSSVHFTVTYGLESLPNGVYLPAKTDTTQFINWQHSTNSITGTFHGIFYAGQDTIILTDGKFSCPLH